MTSPNFMRRLSLRQRLHLAVIPAIIAATICGSVLTFNAHRKAMDARDGARLARLVEHGGRLAAALSKEKDLAINLTIRRFKGQLDMVAMREKELVEAKSRSDALAPAFAEVLAGLTPSDFPAPMAKLLREFAFTPADLARARETIAGYKISNDAIDSEAQNRSSEFYNAFLANYYRLLSQMAQRADGAVVYRRVRLIELSTEFRRYYLVARHHALHALPKNTITAEDLASLTDRYAALNAMRKNLELLMDVETTASWRKVVESPEYQKIENAIRAVIDRGPTGNYGITQREFEESAGYIFTHAINDFCTDVARSMSVHGDQVAQDYFAIRNALAVGVLVALVLAILGAALIGRDSVRSLQQSIAAVDAASTELGQVFLQINAASHTLADNTTRQAAAIVEITTSIQRLDTTTRGAKEQTDRNLELISQTAQTVREADDRVGQLTVAMKRIAENSGHTQRILKTIDEIAFQTNILAINAAVEAARAGEAGAGFAVVAEEVRALARRAANASRETSSLVEQSVAAVGEGTAAVSQVGDAFAQVRELQTRSHAGIERLAAAAAEQTVGLGEIRQACADVDAHTHSTAAQAEQTASQSEELNAQAESMQAVVRELHVFLSGAHAEIRQVAPRAHDDSPGAAAEDPEPRRRDEALQYS